MKYSFFFLLFMLLHGLGNAQVLCGADRMEAYDSLLKGKRVSLVINQTSVVGCSSLLDTLYSRSMDIVQVFTPEHGFRGNADAGETVNDERDVRTNIPIISLYGKNKKPLPAQLAQTDLIVFDIQDVGARFYTYISTLYYVMQACAENSKKLIILDRPNPCDYVGGPVLEKKYQSFVGMLPIPILHGCTVGELAQMINGEGWLGDGLKCDMVVIPVKGWKHGQPYSLPIKPSPNLPNDQAIAFYASLCPFEGTSVSVGRGTLFPFQMIGSPDLTSYDFQFVPRFLEGFDKNPLHKDKCCYGIDLRNVEVPEGFTLKYVLQFYADYAASSRNPEKEFFTRPEWFDLLMGTDQVRLGIIAGKTEKQICNEWEPTLQEYKSIREKYLLYEE